MRVSEKLDLKQRLVAHPRAYQQAARAHRLLRYAARRPHEREFRFFARLPDNGGLFLDVGANTGTSAMSFRIYNRHSRILSIEPNPTHERDLRIVKRIVPRFDYLLCAAGERDGRLMLHVPVYRGIAVTGEATLLSDELDAQSSWFMRDMPRPQPGEYRVERIDVEVRRLDDLRLSPDYVKLDVEGAELPALKGLDETIRRSRPIMLIEAAALPTIADQLDALDYEAFALHEFEDRLDPYRGQPVVNVFCLPRGADDQGSSRAIDA